MARLSWVQRLYWRYLSKPVACREVFLHVLENPVNSILEIGMGDGERAKAVIPLCWTADSSLRIRYAALDPFESGGAGRVSIKNAHRLLQGLGVKAHLIPGEPESGVVRVAHSVLPSDLVIVDGHWDTGTVASQKIAEWLPRLCHHHSAVFASREEGGKLTRIEATAAVESQRLTKAA